MASKDDHTCRSIMTTKPVVIKETETVSKGMRMLLDNRLLGLPVVDNGEHYRGCSCAAGWCPCFCPPSSSWKNDFPRWDGSSNSAL